MAISDITKIMAMYNPPSDFDQDGWKKAFDISNAFAATSEKHRANRENLATSDWRVQNMNNGYQTGIEKNNLSIAELQRQYGNALATDPSAIQATIAKNNHAVTGYDMGRDSLQGQQEYLQLKQKYAFNADGSPRTEPEMYQAMLADGVTPQSPYAVSNFWQASNQARGNKQALLDKILQSAEEVIIDPATGERKRTGSIRQDMLQHGLNNYIATGLLTKGDAEQLTNQLFPFSPTHSLLPAGLSIGGGLAPQLEKLNHAQPTQVVPYAEGFSPPDQAIPYARSNLSAITAQSIEPNVASDGIDYQGKYGITDRDMQLVTEFQNATGLDLDSALKKLSSVFYARQHGYLSPQEAISGIRHQIASAREAANRHQLLRDKLPEIQKRVNLNDLDLIGYTLK